MSLCLLLCDGMEFSMFKDIIYIDWTLVFNIVNTLILFLVLKHFLYNKVKKVLDDRKNEVEGIYSVANKAKEDALTMQAEYEEKLAMAKETANGIIKDATKKAQVRGDEIVTEAHTKASAMLNQAGEQIEQDKKKAINEIKNDITDLAMGAASQVVKKELDENEHRRLIEDFIESTGDIKWQS